MKCADCQYCFIYEQGEIKGFYCRYYPPKQLENDTTKYSAGGDSHRYEPKAVFPRVYETCWCGKFKLKL